MDGNTSNLKETLESIDKYVDSQREVIERGEALARLRKLPDFQLVIMDGYIEAEARRLFTILTDPSGSSPISNEEIQHKLASISDFKAYIGTPDFKGQIDIESELAPGKIAMEMQERSRVTAEYALDGDI